MLFQAFQFSIGRGGPFSQALIFLERLGLLDAIIPFILIFAIFYAILRQTEIFKNNNVDAVVSLSIALITVIPHVLGVYPPNADVVSIINRAAPEVALIVVALVLAMVMSGLVTGKDSDKGFRKVLAGAAPYTALVIMVFVLWGALTPAGRLPGFLKFVQDPFFYSIMIIIIVFGGVVGIVIAGGGSETGTGGAGGRAGGG